MEAGAPRRGHKGSSKYLVEVLSTAFTISAKIHVGEETA